ncbi:MAG TPA: DUF6209 family protein [Kofleriaceae bacterium]|jgi:hypothetical protein|nr:DUF6209 family protein [Kofleriaceae bacterium]
MLRYWLLALLVGCSATSVPESETAPQPLSGVDGSADAADHACNVVLRSLIRDSDGIGYVTSDGDYVWAGSIEISSAAQGEGLVPSALYQVSGDPAWYVAAATPSQLAPTPGYARYDVSIDAGTGVTSIQVVPYLALAQGGRLFDHNRNAGDSDNYVLDAPDFAIWSAETVCAPTATADLVFDADFTQTRTGLLQAGSDVSVVYDSSRLGGCREVQSGIDQWAVTAHVAFSPGNEQQDAIVTDAPATMAVPSDAQSVAVWFEATNVDGCHQWDSNYAANYVFQMMRAPQWIGGAENLFTRDDSTDDGTDPCDGGPSGYATPAGDGFQYDTWVRERAALTNGCVQFYQPGYTDVQDPNLWQDFDVELQIQVTATTWTQIPVSFDRYVGNNARYKFSWRDYDPFRDYNCPQTPVTPTSDGMYVQTQLGYYVTVNGVALPGSGTTYTGTFIDYPDNPWRDANCGSAN